MINNTGLALLATVPPGSPSSLQLLPASSVGGLAGPFASVLYVDQVRGNDATAVRGNANLPYATPQAAINAMQTDDTVQIAPQPFTIAVTLTVPATVVRGAFVGSFFGGNPASPSPALGPSSVLFSSTTDLFNLGANLGLAEWIIADLAMRTTLAGKSCILADGSAYAAGTFLAANGNTGGLILRHVAMRSVSPANVINAKYAGGANLLDVLITSGPCLFTTCGIVNFDNVRGVGSSITVTKDSADPLAPAPGQPCSFQLNNGTRLGTAAFGSGVVIGGQVSVQEDETCIIGSLSGSGLTVNGAAASSCVCDGVVGSIDFATAGKEIPDAALVMSFIFQGARLFQNGFTTIAPGTFKAKVAGAAVNFQSVNLDSTVTVPGAAITADNGIHITGRGARWPNATLATPGATGDIVPPQLAGTIDLSAGGAVAKTWNQLGAGAGFVRAGAAPDAAFVTPNIKGSDSAITVRATTGLTFDSNAVANNAADWLAIWK